MINLEVQHTPFTVKLHAHNRGLREKTKRVTELTGDNVSNAFPQPSSVGMKVNPKHILKEVKERGLYP